MYKRQAIMAEGIGRCIQRRWNSGLIPTVFFFLRFAEFVEGGSHLDDEAILAYESNHLTPLRDEDLMTTDEDDDEEEET